MSVRASRVVVILAALAVVCRDQRILAWGEAGHQAVAAIAEARLAPAAKSEVTRLLAGRSMAGESMWADQVRSTTHKHTNAWHAVNIPLDGMAFDRQRDCANGDCAVAAIERLTDVLGNASAPDPQRQEALRFLIHFVADIHQPLHAIRGGGSDRPVTLGGETDLHGVWDSGIIRASALDAASLSRWGETWIRRNEPQDPAARKERGLAEGTPVDWANESFGLARDRVLVQLQADNAISPVEREDALRIVEERIGRAGVRLAALLNRVLGGGKQL
jgi:nuclease S1